MPVDFLAFGPHPDDAEIGCGGLLRKMKALGHTTGIVDMTAGEMGWGTPEIRAGESARAAEILKLDLGAVLVVGCLAGILPALGGLWVARWCNRRMAIPLRAVQGATGGAAEAAAARDASELPGFGVSIAPVLLPIVLIAAASVAASLGGRVPAEWAGALMFLGNKNVALFLGAAIAVAVYLRQKRLGWRGTDGVIAEPLAIRTRLKPRAHYRVGDGNPANAFVHIDIRGRKGRTLEQKKAAVQAIYDQANKTLDHVFKARPLALTVEYHEIDSDTRLLRNGMRERIAISNASVA